MRSWCSPQNDADFDVVSGDVARWIDPLQTDAGGWIVQSDAQPVLFGLWGHAGERMFVQDNVTGVPEVGGEMPLRRGAVVLSDLGTVPHIVDIDRGIAGCALTGAPPKLDARLIVHGLNEGGVECDPILEPGDGGR
jgi:hypothetical protein